MTGLMGDHSATKLKRRYQPMAEINVTPFVDVMLVLLVVFMVTAPLLTVGVKVDLPRVESKIIKGNDEPLTVSINGAGEIYLQEGLILLQELVPKLRAITSENPEARIFVRGDKEINYGLVMEIMGAINSAGFEKVALVTKMPLLSKN